MASEGGPGIPYIGSCISLVSKSEIRYEGILYTIDTKESNIALQNGEAAMGRDAGHTTRPAPLPR